ncbi:MAG: galactokinase [Candidatus Bathyarchaeota archaeon]|nr:galactokinase [Candidatus Bathyarchaeota archaeon]
MSIAEIHQTRYGSEPDGVYKAPGRVNLIGEHTDYNDGYVFPTPISRHIEVSIKKRDDQHINLHSHDFRDDASYKTEGYAVDPEHHWANYVLGVVQALQKRGHSLGGFDMCIKGDVPIGAGLSSSAALETAVVRSLKDQFKLDLDPVDAAYVGKECENNFVGVQSGIMDQFVSSLGEYGKALFIDCRTNEYSLHGLTDDVRVVIVNSMMDRSLAGSEYNIRHAQCTEAVDIIKKTYPEVKALRDVTEEMLLEQWGNLPKLIARRARHVVTENTRVLESTKLLDIGDMLGFGELMYDSHDSLQHDYEVSSKHLDLLVDYTMDLDGVLGARLTGAGFGGCTVNLVEVDCVDEFTEEITERYFNRTAKRCEVYLA